MLELTGKNELSSVGEEGEGQCMAVDNLNKRQEAGLEAIKQL